jgi:hypothetical protein
MKARTIVLTLALCLGGVRVGFARDAFMGVWKLKEAKSEFSPGAPKNTIAGYTYAVPLNTSPHFASERPLLDIGARV